ncbi:protein-tyrosine phosphatase-like protein [Amylocystis lapponica]|nr:protein-tyrosine phosphatase-like protein [Amylocystis lapponica]
MSSNLGYPSLPRFHGRISSSKFHNDFLPQASEIIPGLFVCDMYTATSPAVLTALGITHIVSCIKPALPTRMAGIQQICIPIDDSKQADLLGYLDYAVYWMAKAMRTKGNVVVHCMWGMSRSASIAIAYLIAVERMSLESALRLVRSKRQVVRPNAGFLRQLQVYEKVTRLREEQVIREQRSVRPRQV